jgi:hypothetical protein
MGKAYDVKVLVEKLKAKGLDLAEETVKIIVGETIDWAVESAQVSSMPYDDVIALVAPQIKKKALELADKIDGQEG